MTTQAETSRGGKVCKPKKITNYSYPRIMNITDYATLETARLLERAGYPQDAHSDVKVYILTRSGKYEIVSNAALTSPSPQRVVAPHLWDAMKWLREKCNLLVLVGLSEAPGYDYSVISMSEGLPTPNIEGTMREIAIDDLYGNYEAACDAGIAAACELPIAHLMNKASKN